MMFEGCPRCREAEFASNLDVKHDFEDLRGLTRDALSSWKGEGIWRFSPLLPVAEEEHRTGLECYKVPSIAPGDETVLEPGMVINIETPYYELGFVGLQVEDTVG